MDADHELWLLICTTVTVVTDITPFLIKMVVFSTYFYRWSCIMGYYLIKLKIKAIGFSIVYHLFKTE